VKHDHQLIHVLVYVSYTSQHRYLTGHTNSRTYKKIISGEPRDINILILLSHDTSQAQGKILATLVIAQPFTGSDDLDSFYD
jgi:hypothetical protein